MVGRERSRLSKPEYVKVLPQRLMDNPPIIAAVLPDANVIGYQYLYIPYGHNLGQSKIPPAGVRDDRLCHGSILFADSQIWIKFLSK